MASYYYTHRKLLQTLNNTNIPTVQTCLYFCTTTENNTMLHSGFCPKPCLEICPSICHHSISTIFTPNISLSQPNKPHNLSPLLISMLILLASTFLLITFYVLYTKLYSNFHQNNNNPTRDFNIQTRDRRSSPLTEEHLRTMIFHPIWYILTVGLNPTVINSIKVKKYEKGMEDNDCAVCLGEFIEGDELRVLPKCCHAFHVLCIDTWLKSHVTCPLCRAPIETSSDDHGNGETCDVSTTVTRDDGVVENEELSREEVVIDVNNNVEDCLENSKEQGLDDDNNKGSSSQKWSWEREAASLVSRSLSCSGKIFSSRSNNRPSPNS